MIKYALAVQIEGIDTLNFGSASMGNIPAGDLLPHIGKGNKDFMDYDDTHNLLTLKTSVSDHVYTLSNVKLENAQINGDTEMLSSENANVVFAFNKVNRNDPMLLQEVHGNFQVDCGELSERYNALPQTIQNTIGLCFDPMAPSTTSAHVYFSFDEFTF
jgi:hypothetical protein